MNASRFQLCVRYFVFAFFVFVGSEHACSQSIDVAASNLAKQIKSILLQKKVNPPAAAVEGFEIRPENSPSSTLGIQERVREQLEAAGVSTKSETVRIRGTIEFTNAIYCVSGNVHLTEKSETIAIGARGSFPKGVQAEIDRLEKKRTTQKKTEPVAAVVQTQEDVSGLAGLNYEAADLGDFKKTDRNAALEENFLDSISNPEVHVSGSTVSAYEDGVFRVELLTKGPKGYYSQKPRVTTTKDGHAFVDLKQGDEFAIKIINNAQFDVGAQILIDGLDSFAFSQNPGYRKLKLYNIGRLGGQPEKYAPLIRGWHIDNEHVNEFNITTLPNSAVAELGQSFNGKVGVINVQFFPAWNVNQPPPAVELKGARDSQGRGGLGVGRGDVVKQRFHEVKRNFGRTIVGSISIRYQHP